MAHILILGGGAAGLAAALAAAQAAPAARVTVLERNPKVGKKLLATGNGRCNLDNTAIAPEKYFTADPAALRPLLAAVDAAAPLAWFEQLGLYTRTDEAGRVYPYSNQAADVLALLELHLQRHTVQLRTGCTVNKWENSNSKPDIELLAPIARLLDISLDTLLSFHEKLSDTEIEEIIRKMDRMFSEEGYEKTYEWALRLIKEYPNCNMLIWQTAVMLDARRITDKCINQEKYDKQINAWYELALHDENEEIQHHAADSLFGFYLRKKDYTKAEKYLDYFSEYDPMKSYYQGRLLQKQGKIKEAYEKYENIIFSGFSTLNFVLSTMAGLALRENDIGYARFLSGKVQAVAHTLEMGKYNEYSPMLDIVCAGKDVEGTYKVVKHLLDNVGTMYDFRKSGLYKHMKFRDIDEAILDGVKEKLLEGFRNEEEFGYMAGYEPWEKLIFDR